MSKDENCVACTVKDKKLWLVGGIIGSLVFLISSMIWMREIYPHDELLSFILGYSLAFFAIGTGIFFGGWAIYDYCKSKENGGLVVAVILLSVVGIFTPILIDNIGWHYDQAMLFHPDNLNNRFDYIQGLSCETIQRIKSENDNPRYSSDDDEMKFDGWERTYTLKTNNEYIKECLK